MLDSLTGTVSAWIIGILVVILLGTAAVEEIRIGHWSDQVDTLTKSLDQAHDDLAVSRGNVATLKASLDKQNQKIKDMAADAVEKQKEAETRVKTAMAASAARQGRPITGTGPAGINAWLQQEYGVTP